VAAISDIGHFSLLLRKRFGVHNVRVGGRKDFQTRLFFALDLPGISLRNSK
jgi:hypothetical protein